MGLLIAALITTVVSVATIGFLIVKLFPPAPRWLLVLAFLSALPAQPIAFYLIRLPLHEFLLQWIGPGALLIAISLCYAPLIEEPAKWFSLVLPSLRRHMTPKNAVSVALAVGLGFGTGEIWFIAERLARQPQIAALPFYAFQGFLLERLMVCFLHGAMIALLFKRFAEGKSLWWAALLGIALHFLLNFPIYLSQINLFRLGGNVWGLLLFVYVLLFTLAMFFYTYRLAKDGAVRPDRDKAGKA
ncbi:MAG TPA: PrsW family glutamic-type intramembrane protease [Xanthobacteraceae bacterium]|nr:PrsW family glutamic-type intramembrane protease [Xanthobacteraceae bacterium]